MRLKNTKYVAALQLSTLKDYGQLHHINGFMQYHKRSPKQFIETTAKYAQKWQ